MLGGKFDEALQLASDLHREQHRKGGTSVPYLAHLMAVAGNRHTGATAFGTYWTHFRIDQFERSCLLQ